MAETTRECTLWSNSAETGVDGNAHEGPPEAESKTKYALWSDAYGGVDRQTPRRMSLGQAGIECRRNNDDGKYGYTDWRVIPVPPADAEGEVETEEPPEPEPEPVGPVIPFPDDELLGAMVRRMDSRSREAGEGADHVKKAIRDDGDMYTPERLEDLGQELGDVLWYVAALARDLDMDLDRIAQANLDKLRNRQRRGALQGSGDQR